MASIVTDDLEHCYICKKILKIETPKQCIHHIFGGTANRKLSDKYGLVIPLCNAHHNISDEGTHFFKEINLKVKQEGQKAFEKTHTREEFISIFGRNYL